MELAILVTHLVLKKTNRVRGARISFGFREITITSNNNLVTNYLNILLYDFWLWFVIVGISHFSITVTVKYYTRLGDYCLKNISVKRSRISTRNPSAAEPAMPPHALHSWPCHCRCRHRWVWKYKDDQSHMQSLDTDTKCSFHTFLHVCVSTNGQSFQEVWQKHTHIISQHGNAKDSELEEDSKTNQWHASNSIKRRSSQRKSTRGLGRSYE